jgi:P-type E1-E2 ATPase
MLNMKYKLQGDKEIEVKTIILDLNGTLSVKGKIVEGVKERFAKLKEMGIDVVFLSGDQRGTAEDLAKDLGIEFTKAKTGKDKEHLFLKHDPNTTAAIGNARIDNGKFKHAIVSVATIQAEGIHVGVLQHVDILVTSVLDALDIFIDPNSLAATMKE